MLLYLSIYKKFYLLYSTINQHNTQNEIFEYFLIILKTNKKIARVFSSYLIKDIALSIYSSAWS